MKTAEDFAVDWTHAGYKFRNIASDIGNAVLAEIFNGWEECPPQIEMDIDDTEPHLYIKIGHGDELDRLRIPLSQLECVVHDIDASAAQRETMRRTMADALRSLADNITVMGDETE